MFTVRTTAFEKAKIDASASAAVEAVNSEDMAAAQVTTLKLAQLPGPHPESISFCHWDCCAVFYNLS